MLVEWSQHDEHVIAALTQSVYHALERVPLGRCVQGDPIEASLAGGISGPRFVPLTLRAALWIIPKLHWNGHSYLGKRISINVRIAWWVAASLLQRPFWNALLSEIGVLQMAHPLKERNVPFHNRIKPLVGVRPVTGNPRKELRHQRGMVELLFLVRAEVGLGTRHPQDVAMQQH